MVSRLTVPTSWFYECRDGRQIECVLMAEESRRTVCLSTQVGCGMGCVFCASGLNGVERNLSTDEILEQVSAVAQPFAAGRNGHAYCRHGDGGEPGKPRQPDHRTRSALLGQGRVGNQPAAGDHLDGGVTREDREAGGAGSAVSFGGLASCADRSIAQHLGAG